MTPDGQDAHPDDESGQGDAQQLVCSAKGCGRDAAVALRWNNPKIHTPERRKTWLACPEHQESLTSFLAARGFMRETEELDSAES